MLDELSEKIWDALIVGAGPSGAALAALLAGRGWTVLLVDRSEFPRDKTCGGCVNASAIAALHEMGLQSVVRGAPAIDRFDLNVAGRRLNMKLAPGVAIARDQFDAAIVAEAVKRGCRFVANVSAQLTPSLEDDVRSVMLRSGDSVAKVSARMAFACDGIRGTLLDQEPDCDWLISQNSWFGIAANDCNVRSDCGTIHMSVSKGGYVGRVRFANGRTHLAAALDVAEARIAGGPARLVSRILADCGQSVDLDGVALTATPRLTRRRRLLGGHRVLAIGDACGYVEPFTGEGIGWALRGVLEVAELLPNPREAWPADLPQRWTSRHRSSIRRRQTLCRAIRQLAHRPRLAKVVVSAIAMCPSIGESLVQRLGSEPTIARSLTHGTA